MPRRLRDAMLARLIARPDLLAESKGLLRPEHFDGLDETGLAFLWKAVLDIDERFGSLSYDQVADHLEMLASDDPAGPTAEELTNLLSDDPDKPGLLYHALHGVDPAELHIEQGRDLVQRFLAERTIADPIRDAADSMDGGSADDFGGMLQELQARYERITAIGGRATACGRPTFVSAADLLLRETAPSWLVQNVLVLDQPCIIGGPQKSLKTSVAMDLVVSLAAGPTRSSRNSNTAAETCTISSDAGSDAARRLGAIAHRRVTVPGFLGRFPVPRAFRVGFVSGESGEHVLKETLSRVMQARGIRAEDLGDRLHLSFELPKFGDEGSVRHLTRQISRHDLEAVVIDPLYLCLLSGGDRQVSATNLFDMGPLLLRVARACLDADCTPILIHHTKKPADRRAAYEPPELTDLAFSGPAEFARQWLLLGRRNPLDEEADPRVHELWLRYGGSFGHGGLKALDVTEGRLNTEFGGRQWLVRVRSVDELRTERARETERARDEQKQRRREEVLCFIRRHSDGVAYSNVVASARMNPKTGLSFLEAMAGDGLIRIEMRQVGGRVFRTIHAAENGGGLRNGDS